MTLLTTLEQYLDTRVPGACLELIELPQASEVALWLMQADYPQGQLSDEQAIALMDAPPYWSFCWASGQVLAQQILRYPEWVRDQNVVDFGAGSGVVAIAAALAGAKRAIAVDSDPLALTAAQVNAEQNGVEIEVMESLETAQSELGEECAGATCCVADVFYDRDNIPLLGAINDTFGQRLIADSRLGGAALPGVDLIDQVNSSTVPDLNESKDFNHVCIYRGLG